MASRTARQIPTINISRWVEDLSKWIQEGFKASGLFAPFRGRTSHIDQPSSISQVSSQNNIPPPTQGVGEMQNFVDTVVQMVNENAAEHDDMFSASGIDTDILAPTNNVDPASATATPVSNNDGSMDIVLTWTYTQGALPADNFILFWKEAASAPSAITTADNCVAVAATANAFRFEGLNPTNHYIFGIAAARRPTATSGYIIGTIIQPSTGAANWNDKTFGVGNYVNFIQGVEQHNWNLTAAGAQVGSSLVGQIGLTKDGSVITWSAVDEEYNGHSFSYGLSYNLLVYDLANKSTSYAHCYDVFDYGTAVTDADLIEPVTTGTGAVDWAQSGKFGNALKTIGVDSSNRGYYRTRAASANYTALAMVEIWFKCSAAPAAQGTIVGLHQTSTADASYRVPVFALNTNGTVSAYAWDGAAFVAVNGTTNVCNGNWHKLRAQVNGSVLRLRVDGVSEGTASTLITTLTVSPPASLYIHLGTGNGNASGDLATTAYYDELLVSTNSGATTATTVETAEFSDYLAGASGTIAIWHFQESWSTNYFCNARKAARALANVINGYNTIAGALGDGTRYLLALHASYEPQANRTNDGLPDAIASIGGNRALFSSAQFRAQSAYLLVGQPLLGEGNGIEMYAGKTDNANDAVCKSTFQTQGSKLIALSGTGWTQTHVPGAPTNDPSGGTLTASTSDTGQRQHKLNWNYTQPSLSGDNKLADGFLIKYEKADTITPAEQFLVLGADARNYTFEWSLPAGSVVSYSIYAFRRTASGVELGNKHQGTGWKGVTASLYVQSLDPNPPNGSFTTSSFTFTSTTLDTGGRSHKLVWVWTDGSLVADGFVLYYQTGSTSTPTGQQVYLNNDARDYTFEWGFAAGTTVSYAITAYRRTINGIEETSKVAMSGSGWQNKAADSTITTAGIGTDQVTTPKVLDDNMTTAKRQAVGTQTYTTGSINANSGSNPVVFSAELHTFNSFGTLAKAPIVVPYASSTSVALIVYNRAVSAIDIVAINLGGTNTITYSIDFW